MARLRKVEVTHFRGIKSLSWLPHAGINCFIGPGDGGKSTVLDAIDLCLGARRTFQFTDADFFGLDVGSPISISLTIGDLDDALKNIDSYGLFLRAFDPETGEIEDEPEKELEVVLTLNLTVESDLEPSWSLVSDRAKAQNVFRNLSWDDRIKLAPTRIGALSDFNLGWRRGSVLNRLTEEKPDASGALAKAARDARQAFGEDVEIQLGETLRIVGETARELGIDVGARVRALLDAHSVTFSGGVIALHGEDGVPVRGLGVGSTRILIAGLQRKAAAHSSVLLVDELEYGLEPHRIIRFLGSLGAKEQNPPLQAIITTHSPIALRELSGNQLFILRKASNAHIALNVGTEDEAQSTVRLYPDAFLAKSVLVCEGASEVGLVRGLDQYEMSRGAPSVFAKGLALVDCGGGDPDRPFQRAAAFCRLGYRVAVLRDADTSPAEGIAQDLLELGGNVFSWRDERALEDVLFLSLPIDAVQNLINLAVELHGEDLIDAHIRSVSQGVATLVTVRLELLGGDLERDTRMILGLAARTRKAGWFKSVSWMETATREIIAPAFAACHQDFRAIVSGLFGWAGRG
jgi:putative ATP-dependent endonuclease of the OLD family